MPISSTLRSGSGTMTLSVVEQSDSDALLRHFKEGVARSLGGTAAGAITTLASPVREWGCSMMRSRSSGRCLEAGPTDFLLPRPWGKVSWSRNGTRRRRRCCPGPSANRGDDEQRVGVLYLLAYSCDALQRLDEARSYYQRVYATDIHFRNAAARLAALDQVAR